MLKYLFFYSLIGEIGMVWDQDTQLLKQVILPEPKTQRQRTAKIMYHGVIKEIKPDKFALNVMSDIKDIIMGKDIKFPLELIDFTDLTDFQKEVLIKQSEIPHARVVTYKQLAELVGKPKSARPVANVLSNNIFPLVIPCHRTVRSDWTVGGYAGINDCEFKQFILENEGIRIESGVIKKEFRYLSNDNNIVV